MKKRPNPFWHMMLWGFGSGTILALAYIIVLADFMNGFEGGVALLTALVSPWLWQFAFMVGGIPGAVMGFFCALTLWSLLRNAPLPFTQDDMKAKRVSVYGWIFTLTLLISFMLISLFFGSLFDTFLLIIPPFIAAIAASYAAHRYMFRLRLWSGGIESRKSKAKNDALLRLSQENDEQDDRFIEATASKKRDYLR